VSKFPPPHPNVPPALHPHGFNLGPAPKLPQVRAAGAAFPDPKNRRQRLGHDLTKPLRLKFWIEAKIL